jgi:hypothetical protein
MGNEVLSLPHVALEDKESVAALTDKFFQNPELNEIVDQRSGCMVGVLIRLG